MFQVDTHARAAAGLHGCTVHLVTAGMDEGPILAQAAVPVLQDDTEYAAARAGREHRFYRPPGPLAAGLVQVEAGGRWYRA